MYEMKMISYLMAEAESEIALIREYEEALQTAMAKAKETEKVDGKGHSYWFYMNWDKPMPNKTKVKDNMKMIRRLSLKVEKLINNIK